VKKNAFKVMQMAGQTATATFEEVTVKNLRTGLVFRAKIQPLPSDVSLKTELGVDPRATDVFHVRDKSVLRGIKATDLFFSEGARFMYLPAVAPDNPAVLHLELHMQAGVPGVDDWAGPEGAVEPPLSVPEPIEVIIGAEDEAPEPEIGSIPPLPIPSRPPSVTKGTLALVDGLNGVSIADDLVTVTGLHWREVPSVVLIAINVPVGAGQFDGHYVPGSATSGGFQFQLTGLPDNDGYTFTYIPIL
jgi:hypothetical protein